MNYSNLYIDEKFKEKIFLFYWQSFPPKYPKILNFHSPLKKKKERNNTKYIKTSKNIPSFHKKRKRRNETPL